MPLIPNPEVEVLLPVHNEGDSIEATIRELYEEFSPRVRVQFIVCEDGSKDNTKEVLTRLDQTLPMNLELSDARKGYSRAVVDGMMKMRAPYLLCIDSDGQCDPKDFWQFWEAREKADVLLGWRTQRADNPMRKLMSRGFFYIYQLFYHVPIHDPSCPYMLARKEVVQQIAPFQKEMKQGFWWEYVARCHLAGFSIKEFPIHHRDRAAGETQVYKLRKLPEIGYKHFMALFKIRQQKRLVP